MKMWPLSPPQTLTSLTLPRSLRPFFSYHHLRPGLLLHPTLVPRTESYNNHISQWSKTIFNLLSKIKLDGSFQCISLILKTIQCLPNVPRNKPISKCIMNWAILSTQSLLQFSHFGSMSYIFLIGSMLPITSRPLHFLDPGFLAQYKICLMESHLSFAYQMSIIQEVAPYLIGFSVLPWE